jgi:glucosamine--fructose-6-phosphate aminotransferase (isomerizing)
VAQLLRLLPDEVIVSELRSLEGIPAAMERVLEQKERIHDAVTRLIKGKQHWAVVGSGPNKAAADEIRIKLSELCYRPSPPMSSRTRSTSTCPQNP